MNRIFVFLLFISVLAVNAFAQSGVNCNESVKSSSVRTTADPEDSDKVQIFAGYSVVHFKERELEPHAFGKKFNAAREGFNLNGWNGSVAYRVSEYFSLVGDLSGHYGDVRVRLNKKGRGIVQDYPTNLHGFHFGIKYDHPAGPGRVYAQILPGVSRLSGGGSEPTTKFSNLVGVGYDVRLTKSLSYRNEISYAYTKFNEPDDTSGQHGFRYSTGIVFRW